MQGENLSLSFLKELSSYARSHFRVGLLREPISGLPKVSGDLALVSFDTVDALESVSGQALLDLAFFVIQLLVIVEH